MCKSKLNKLKKKDHFNNFIFTSFQFKVANHIQDKKVIISNHIAQP